MKVRLGFISNSSSSSFVIRKEYLTFLQIYAIKHHTEVGKELNMSWYEGDERWSICDTDFEINGYTGMDNFNMHEFLEKINVPLDKVEWG